MLLKMDCFEEILLYLLQTIINGMIDIFKVKTELLLEETKTSGHAPLKFICSDNNLYYCKYLVDFDPN